MLKGNFPVREGKEKVLTRRGSAWPGGARQGKARHGPARQGNFKKRRAQKVPIKKTVKKHVTLTGRNAILFDRYSGDKTTKLTPEQKVYLGAQGELVLPALNLLSFLSAQNTRSAPKAIYDPRKYKQICYALGSSVEINPDPIPFQREGALIIPSGYNEDGWDEKAKLQLRRDTPRLPNGIPNETTRPMLALPWELEFDLTIFPDEDLSMEMIENVFSIGGLKVGLGTFRGVYGKFDFSWK